MGRPKLDPADRTTRESVINLKGSSDYSAWLESIHRETRLPKATIIRVALEQWAERQGHPAPPAI